MGFLGGKTKTPKAPDPVVVSQAQTESNQNTAAYNTALGRQNTYTPLGSQTYEYRGKDPATGAPMWDEHVQLAPDAQGLLDQQISQNRQLGDIAGGMMDQVASTYSAPMNTSGVPQLATAPNMGTYRNNIDMSNLPELYGASNLDAARTQAQDALYKRQAAYLDPQFSQIDNASRTRMKNQGIVEGSEAWRNALDDDSRAREFAYGQARDSSIAGGGDEMTRLAAISQANRGQMFGERATNADMYNSATGATNADALRAAGFTNQARSQGLDELYRERNQPLNEFNALRGAAPVEIPQFQGAPSTGAAPTNVADNVWRGYQNQVDLYNGGQASQNDMTSNLFGLAGQLGSAWLTSDERLKSNITKAGRLASGINVYDYEKDGHPERGVLAQEVEQVQPDAVKTGRDGYKRVNYSRVLARAMAA